MYNEYRRYNNDRIDNARDQRDGSREYRPGPENRGRRGGFRIDSLLEGKDEAMLLFVGAASCLRHRGFQMQPLMQEGRMAILLPTAAEYASGKYLHQMKDAMAELSQKTGFREFVLMYGCQVALLSTDFELLAQDMMEEYGIRLEAHAKCHLCRSEFDED